MPKMNPIIGVVLMFVFFFLGAITRQIYLVKGTEWLKGVPQIMGALSFLSLLIFQRQKWWEKGFWLDGLIWKLPSLLIYTLIIVLLIYFGIKAYLG